MNFAPEKRWNRQSTKNDLYDKEGYPWSCRSLLFLATIYCRLPWHAFETRIAKYLDSELIHLGIRHGKYETPG